MHAVGRHAYALTTDLVTNLDVSITSPADYARSFGASCVPINP